MRNITIVLIILLVIISGCGETNKKLSDDYITVNVNKDYPEKKLILQDIMDVEYVTLETTDEFITNGDVKDIGKEFIVVKNRTNDIFIFDRKTGNAIRKINRWGQGNEEYSMITDITLDEDNSEIFVTNPNKILVYDLFGNFKRSLPFIDTNSDYLNIFNYDRSNLIIYNNRDMIPDQESCHLIISKQDGSISREVPIPTRGYKTPVITGENGATAIPVYNPTTPSFRNWILMNISSDTLYTYSPDDEIKPFIVRTPSVHSMDTEIFLFVDGVTDRYYFMKSMKKELDPKTMKIPNTFLAYDKQEKTLFKYKMYNDDFLYEKPVFMGVPVSPEIVTWNPLYAHELTEAYKDGKLKGRLKEIAAELDEDSNPVIMLIKHKK